MQLLQEPGRCKVCGTYVGEEFTWGDNGCIYCTRDDEEIDMEALEVEDNIIENDNEVYHGLVGQIFGRYWWARSLNDDAEGTPGSVNFNWKVIDDRETSHGDVIGFYHTHPHFPGMPSSIDYSTMKTWLISFGRPLLCLIEGTNGLNANWFRDDETPHVRGKIWKIGKFYFGIVPTFPEK